MAEDSSYFAQSGGYIVNALEIQSLEIDGSFNCQEQDEGWLLTMQSTGRISLHFRTSMRKQDFMLQEGDRLIRTPTDIIVVRTHSDESYRSLRTTTTTYAKAPTAGSPLARRTTTQMGSPLSSDVEQIVQATEQDGSGSQGS